MRGARVKQLREEFLRSVFRNYDDTPKFQRRGVLAKRKAEFRKLKREWTRNGGSHG